MRIPAFSFVIFAMLAASPVRATPPQVVSVEQTDGPQQAIWGVYVTCESEGTMPPVSMFITLQAVP